MKASAQPYQEVVERKHFNKIALIDADRLKYLVTYDIFRQMQEGYTRADIKINSVIESKLNAIFNSFSAKGYIFCFSGKSKETFRYQVGFEKEYKGNRNKVDDPYYYEGKIDDMYYVPEYIGKQYPMLIFKDLEADDIISMLQNENTFIYSNDKDLKQIPGNHFNEEKLDLEFISEEDAYMNLMIQLLKGDTTDNIQGLPKVGEKTALKLVQGISPKQVHFAIIHEYQKRFGLVKGLDAFVETWNLVKLRPKRGEYFMDKYKSAFSLLERLQK